jgi:hypothetical protein
MCFDKQNAGHKAHQKKLNIAPLSEVKGFWLRPVIQKGDDEFTMVGFCPAH